MSIVVLLVVSGSLVKAVTVAVLVMVPVLFGAVTVMSIVAPAPPGKMPRLQTTGPVPEQLPWLGDAETNVVPAGSESVTATPLVVAGIVGIPLFVTVK